MIAYLHGFRSAPASEKARVLAERMAERGLADRFWCQQLPTSPREAIEQIEDALRQSPTIPTLVGSSLGGYYATYLAEKHGLKAVLINPAVDPDRILAEFVGPQTNLYTGENFEFTTEHIHQLAQLNLPELTRLERYWLLVETGDELLDYRQAVKRYAGARQTVIQGGNHSFRHFPEFIDSIIEFSEQPNLPP